MCRTRRRWSALLLLSLLLAGCWDRRELEEHSTVLAAGVDLCGIDEGCQLAVSRQIAIPGRVPLGAGEGKGGEARDTVVVIRSPGMDGPDTARRAQARLNRRMSFAHSRVLVFSEAYARQGLADFLGYIRRVPDTRRVYWVAVSEGPAEAVIRAQPSLEQVPSLFLSDMFDDAVKTGRLPNIYLGELMTRISNKGEEAVIPLIRMAAPDRPTLTGLAVFRGDRMVGKLSPEETMTFMEVRGLPRGGELLKVPLPEGQKAELRVYGRQAHWGVRWVNERVQSHVQIELEAELSELSVRLRGSDAEVIALIQREAAKEVSRRAADLTARLQREFGSDIYALGERVRAYLPGTWVNIRDWSAAFAKAQFSFDTRVNVRRSGTTVD